MSIKVAQVCPRYYPYIGGVETHVESISERLAGQGLDVEILTTDPSGNLLSEEQRTDHARQKVMRYGQELRNQSHDQ